MYENNVFLSQVSQSLDPDEQSMTKRGRSNQNIGADFSLLESQTSYIGFEFHVKPSVCPTYLEGLTLLKNLERDQYGHLFDQK